jgi:hypothetical protein
VVPVYRTSLWLNGLLLLLMVGLIAYTKAVGLSAKALFLHPINYPDITIGSLTRLFQILCAVPPVVCLFSVCLLPRSEEQVSRRFLLYSGLLTGGFLGNEIYRFHIHLVIAGIPKPTVILFYALVLLAYGVSFRKQIRATPYPILLLGLASLAVGIGIDALKLSDQNLTDFLEGIPKVLSAANLSFYFWWVGQQAVWAGLKRSPSNV